MVHRDAVKAETPNKQFMSKTNLMHFKNNNNKQLVVGECQSNGSSTGCAPITVSKHPASALQKERQHF